jgi:cellulose synthase/poly-beta-1,6-N-acetylglucosamine synthase-like glycosyltransferase
MACVDLLNIMSGMGGLFRAEILHRLGGYDTGLGDDTDMTTNLRKQRWRLAFSFDAVVWTTVPVTRYHLWRQRMRWRRNMIKIRVSKHRDQFILGRYGFTNALLAAQLLIGRLMLPVTVIAAVLIVLLKDGPLSAPQILVAFYWIIVVYLLIRMLIARDISRTPQPVSFSLILLYPFYFLWLMGPIVYAEICELLRIGAKHPYVPDHIWEEIPWW